MFVGALRGVEVCSLVSSDRTGRCDLGFGVKKRSAMPNVDIVNRQMSRMVIDLRE